MAKTLATIRTQVRSYLDEQSAADWSDAELTRLINVYYHNLRDIAIRVHENYYITTALWSTVANQQEYTSADLVPTDIYKIRRVELNYDTSIANNAPTRMLPIDNVDAIRRDLAYTNAGLTVQSASNGGYYVLGFGSNIKIGFIPIPQNTGVNAIKIWYMKEAVDMSSDSDTLDIPYVDKNWILVAWGATEEALRFGGQASREADKFKGKYDQGTVLYEEALKDRLSEEDKMVQDFGGSVMDFES